MQCLLQLPLLCPPGQPVSGAGASSPCGCTQSLLGFDLTPPPAISDGSPSARSKLPFNHAAGISPERSLLSPGAPPAPLSPEMSLASCAKPVTHSPGCVCLKVA